jgi:hypothetical protein
MNLPVTNPIVKNVPLDKIIPDKLFLDLLDKKFTGYVYLIIEGKYSFEESILILNAGKIEGAIYLIDGYDTEMFGKEAIDYCLNCYGAKNGRLNIFALTSDQIKLILLFNDKIKYAWPIKKSKDLLIFRNIKYNEALIYNLLKEKIVKNKTSKDVLSDFNLDDLLKE